MESDAKIINPWSPGRSFVAQKMAISSPVPAFQGLTVEVTLNIFNAQKSTLRLDIKCTLRLIEVMKRKRCSLWFHQSRTSILFKLQKLYARGEYIRLLESAWLVCQSPFSEIHNKSPELSH